MSGRRRGGAVVETKLDVVVVPAVAVDRFKHFYAKQAAFNVDPCSTTTSASSGSPGPTSNSWAIQQKRVGWLS
jgi:hypothetical protein